MQLRGKLFIKIFVGFWLVTIAILGSWKMTNDYFDEQPDGAAHLGHRPPGPPQRFMLRTIYELQNLDNAALVTALHKIEQRHNAVIYLISIDGSDFLDRKIPGDVKRTANQLRDGKRRGFLNTPTQRFVAYDIYRREQGPMSAVFVFPSARDGLLGALGSSPGLRIALAILISGLICFALSRLLTTRLKDLQQASRRLAQGELETRLQVRDQGGDETDELARDFNSMAQQLQARVQAQKRLLGDVSHELRSPLARLRIALALAERHSEGSSEGNKDYLQRIENEAQRLEELIGQLLSTQSENLVMDSHVDIAALLQLLCADANFEGQAHNKQFQFSSSIGQPIIRSTGDLLRKSFDNIVRNALIHTSDNSIVKVYLSSADDFYSITIEDHGPGVPEEELGKLFGEFYRVDTSRTRESGGYGLGLSIAQRAITQHDGRIVAENTTSGLAITVYLPIQNELS
ncbi:MAG: signal transduction histidine kinase [Halioglobus sp.]|jgi:signal transduction histidine kinase